MDSVRPVKNHIMCDRCGLFKAKHNCMECDKPICLKCRKYQKVPGSSIRDELCYPCKKEFNEIYYGR